LCYWEGRFSQLIVIPSIQGDDELVEVMCPRCHERQYLEFKFECEAEPREIIGYIPKRLPPPQKERAPLFLNSHQAMLWHLAKWLECQDNEDDIGRVMYENIDECCVAIDWFDDPVSIELHTTAGADEEEIRTRPLKWPFTEEQLERAMAWLIRQANKLNEQELRYHRR
jgi:hypothetical protein